MAGGEKDASGEAQRLIAEALKSGVVDKKALEEAVKAMGATTESEERAAEASKAEAEGSPDDDDVRDDLARLLHFGARAKRAREAEGPREHKFWKTQPQRVVEGSEGAAEGGGGEKSGEGGDEGESVEEDGPVEVKTLEDVRKDPYKLPGGFSWCSVDVTKEDQLEELHGLLADNYVEDADEMFRFAYPKELLRWALQPPGAYPEWLVGVRNPAGVLYAFIAGVPVKVCVKGREMTMCEINFLCVHRLLRSKRLAPMLIKEVTRRVNLRNIWQAVYTAGVKIPTPVSKARYWHRSLNVSKLLDIGFCGLGPRQTKSRLIRIHKLPTAPAHALRPMTEDDVPQVTTLLNSYLQSKTELHFVLSEEEVKHTFLAPREVVQAFVLSSSSSTTTTSTSTTSSSVSSSSSKPKKSKKKKGKKGKKAKKGGGGGGGGGGGEGGGEGGDDGGEREEGEGEGGDEEGEERITDFVSFYHLPSQVTKHATHKDLKAAYSFYNVATSMPFKDLIRDALILAKESGADVYNMLALMDNPDALESNQFGRGDGELHYYLYNWNTKTVDPRKLGIVLV